MPWPFPDDVRSYMRMASYWLGLGWVGERIIDWARTSRHFYEVPLMEQAIPEAGRANYFANFIRTHDPATTFQRLWGWAAKGAWYAGYGRAPTATERDWSYSRPSDTIGLALRVTGRGANSGRYQSYLITVNTPWTSSFDQVEAAVAAAIAEGTGITGEFGSEPLAAGSIRVQLEGGALVARQRPTLTLG